MRRTSAAPRSLRAASLAGIGAAFLFARSAAAQTALFDWSGATPQAQLGKAACAPGDLNGDGIGDVVLAERPAPSAWAYRARSGLDGATLWTSTAYADVEGAYAMGDVDGDGVGDVCTSFALPSFARAVVLRSGATGAAIWQFPAVPSVAYRLVDAGHDANGDGAADVLVQYDFAVIGSISLQLRSGTDGALLHSITTGNVDAFTVGRAALAPDVSGDGRADIVRSVLFSNTVHVYGGSPIGLLGTFTTPNPPGVQLNYGASLGSPGDLDGDGINELAIGRSPAPVNPPTPQPLPETYVYRGGTVTLLMTLAPPTSGVGRGVAALGDVSADGVPDFAVFGAPDGVNPGGASVVSGANGATLYSATTGGAAEFPRFVAGPDVNLDGAPEFLRLEPYDDVVGPDFGRVRLITLQPVPAATSTNLDPACASPAGLLAASPPIAGSTPTISLVGGPPGLAGNLALDLGPPASLPLDPALGCALRIDLARAAQWLLVPIATDGSGAFACGFPAPAIPVAAGFPVTMQAFLFGAGPYGVVVSNGVVVTLGY